MNTQTNSELSTGLSTSSERFVITHLVNGKRKNFLDADSLYTSREAAQYFLDKMIANNSPDRLGESMQVMSLDEFYEVEAIMAEAAKPPIPLKPARLSKDMRNNWVAKTVWPFRMPVAEGHAADSGKWELQLYTSKSSNGVGSVWNIQQDMGNGMVTWAFSDYRDRVVGTGASRCTEKTVAAMHLQASSGLMDQIRKATEFYLKKLAE